MQAAEEFVESISTKKPENFKLIVSSHNYQNTPSPEELGDLVSRIQAVGADIVKIATTAMDISDVAHLFRVLVHCQLSMKYGDNRAFHTFHYLHEFFKLCSIMTGTCHWNGYGRERTSLSVALFKVWNVSNILRT